MNKRVINTDILKHIALFETLTGAKVKDCFPDETAILYIVCENEAGKAIGRNGVNVKRLGSLAKKNVKVVEFSPLLEQFIRNLIYPLEVSAVRQEEEDGKVIVTLQPVDSRTRGYIIGHAAKTLRDFENVVKTYFPVDEIKVD